MPINNELIPKGNTRIKSRIATGLLTVKDASAALAGWREACEETSEYVMRGAQSMYALNCMATDFTSYYTVVYKGEYPEAPADVFSGPRSQDVADAISSYLWLRLQSVHGRDGGYIKAATLRGWSNTLVIIASDYVSRNAYDPRIIRGERLDRADSLYSLTDHFVCSVIAKLDLDRHREPTEYWGALEALLMVRRLEAKMVMAPIGARAHNQQIIATKACLLTGVRTGGWSYTGIKHSGNSNQFLKHKDVTIYQTSPGFYDIELDVKHLKGFNEAWNEGESYRPYIPAVTIIGNVQLELAGNLIPQLIDAGTLCCRTDNGPHYFSTVEEFLKSDAAIFTCHSDMPLFRTYDRAYSFTDAPLPGHEITERMRAVAMECGLPNGKPYNFRHGAGDKTRTAFGQEGQQATLNHRVTRNTGLRHYSRGVGNLPVSRLVLGEFAEDMQQERDSLLKSGAERRERQGRAVQAVVRELAGQGHQLGENAPSEEELEEELRGDPTFQAMLQRSLRGEREGSGDSSELSLSQYRALVLRRLRSRKRKSDDSRFVEPPAGSITEYERAYTALQRMRAAAPFILDPPDVPTATVDISRFAPRRAHDNDDTNLMSFETEGDEELARFVQQEIRRGRSSATGSQGQLPGNRPSEDVSVDAPLAQASITDIASEPSQIAENGLLNVWSGDEAGQSPDPPEVVRRVRADYMRAVFGHIRASDQRSNAIAFMESFGWCGLCPLDQVGTATESERKRRNPKGGEQVFRQYGNNAVGIPTATSQGYTHHLNFFHPEESKGLQLGQRPAARADTSVKSYTDRDIQRMAQVMIAGDAYRVPENPASDLDLAQYLAQTGTWFVIVL